MASTKATLLVRVSRELKAFLQSKAEEWQLSVNALVVTTLSRGLQFRSLRHIQAGLDSPPPPRLKTAEIVVKVGRNAPCPCGSGQKYKRYHGQSAAT
jgi:SEC-C motif